MKLNSKQLKFRYEEMKNTTFLAFLPVIVIKIIIQVSDILSPIWSNKALNDLQPF